MSRKLIEDNYAQGKELEAIGRVATVKNRLVGGLIFRETKMISAASFCKIDLPKTMFSQANRL